MAFLKVGSPKRRRRPLRAASRLLLELLEDRSVPSVLPPVDYAVGQGPRAVATGDFTNDGIQDLVTCNAQDNTVSVLLGKGDGTFQPARTFATGPNPWSVAVGDFNGDGKLDIVTANRGYSTGTLNTLSVLLGNGDGTFQAPLTVTLPGEFPPGYTGATPLMQQVYAVAVGDMNHDGKLDLVVAADTAFGSGNITGVHVGYVDVLLGRGDGTFAPATGFPLTTNGDLSHIALADFNGDGNLDVAVEAQLGVSVLLGKGDGTLGAPAHYATGVNPDSLAVGDFNGDGKLDLVTSNYSGESVSVLLGNGDGSFQPAANLSLNGSSSSGNYTQNPEAVVAGDLNHDGKMDLAVTARTSTVVPVPGHYGPYGYYPPSYGTSTQLTVSVLLGHGDGTFTDAEMVPLNGSNPYALTTGDFNGDPFPDLAVADPWANTVSVLLNGADWSTTPQPGSFAVSGFPSSTTAGASGTFTVTALNSDGTTDTSFTGTVHFTSSDGHAALPGDYTFTASDAGVHAFSATLKTAGMQSLTASDGSLTGSETGITVSPAPASQTIVVGFPSPTTAGVAQNFTVTLDDPYGNIASGYRGTVHFTSSDGQAAMPANYTFTTADAGVHTFSATLKTAGTQSLTATDTTAGSLTGSEAGITVKPAAASQFIIRAPSSVTAGVAFALTLTVEDAYGNVVTGYAGTIHFSSTDTMATLPRNYRFTATDKGVHTFTGLILRKKRYQKITITDTLNITLTDSVLVDVL
jgi:hypothetical protein